EVSERRIHQRAFVVHPLGEGVASCGHQRRRPGTDPASRCGLGVLTSWGGRVSRNTLYRVGREWKNRSAIIPEPTETELVVLSGCVIELRGDAVAAGRIRSSERKRTGRKIRRRNHTEDLHRNRIEPTCGNLSVRERLAGSRIDGLLGVGTEVAVSLGLRRSKRCGSLCSLMNP